MFSLELGKEYGDSNSWLPYVLPGTGYKPAAGHLGWGRTCEIQAVVSWIIGSPYLSPRAWQPKHLIMEGDGRGLSTSRP